MMKQWSPIVAWWPMWLPLHSTMSSPIVDERLDRVVLEDEHVLADLGVAPVVAFELT